MKSPMTPKARKELNDIVTTYGHYVVLQAIHEDAEGMLKDHHADAVIQRDIFQLRSCVADMQKNHFLRQTLLPAKPKG